jgi:exosortase A
MEQTAFASGQFCRAVFGPVAGLGTVQASVLMSRITVRSSLWAAGLFCLALLLIYHQTAWSMVYVWSRSETFAHGFLIVPISLWLIWTRREYLVTVNPQPAWWVALLVLPIGLGWLLAWLVDVSVVQQLALVAMMIVGAWAILGHKLGALLAFPLFFLFFAVPIGEGLVAPMMEFTATSTVWLIEMTGIPVYREGLFFTLPTGHWSVVEACSGVRYIIASITVGVLYAYLTYRSWTRRLLFVLVSAIVPVFANTLRAYMIVMLGHTSDMTIATGADHLVYGWVFFGFVIFVLFWLGAFFREDHLDEAPVPARAAEGDDISGAANGKLFATLAGTLLLTCVAPLLAHTLFGSAASELRNSVSFPAPDDVWRQADRSGWGWRPPSRVAGQSSAYYERDGDILGVKVQFPDGTIEGADVIGSSSLFTQNDSIWRVVSQGKEKVRGTDGEFYVDVARVRGPNGELLVWSWYVVGGVSTSNDYQAKMYQTLSRLGFNEPGTYRLLLATPVVSDSESDTAAVHLQDFLTDYVPLVYQALRQVKSTAY